MALSYSYTLSDGTTAYGSQVQANFNNISTLLNTTLLDGTYIQNLALTNAHLSATAAVALSKLAAGSAAGQLIVTGAASTYTPAYQTITGDVAITSGGVTAIGSGKVTNAMLAGSIAYSNLSLTGAILNADLAGSIAYSKLSLAGALLANDHSLASGKIILGNGSNVGAAVTPSGDWTMTNAGVSTIADNAVTSRKLSATSGLVYCTATTSLNNSFADVTGMNTGNITPAVNCTIEIDLGFQGSGASNFTFGRGKLQQSNTGTGGSFSDVTGGASSVNMEFPLNDQGGGPINSIGFGMYRVSLTGGTTYAWKAQARNTSSSATLDGNIIASPASAIRWRIIA